MDLLDHKYVALEMGDGSTKYLPVSLLATCADRPSVDSAQAQISQALPDSFVPTGYFLDPEGCLIDTNPGGGGDGGDPGESTDNNPLANTDISGENGVIYEQAP